MKQDYLLELMRAKNSVFTTSDVALLWGEPDVQFVRKKLYRYLKAKKLYSLRRGIYAKAKEYDTLELATKIFTPAYISFETVLAKAGVIFQFYGQIFVASYLTREITVNGQAFAFRKIRNTILTNQVGLVVKDTYCIASPERAFLDILYLHKDYYFDHLDNLDWNKVLAILPIYGGNKRMSRLIQKYRTAAEKA
ncbi:MAG: type IV toxin-antitoxin system AbiEi family antitoxin domain-containing protein [bacterium]|nr:type IV toxin-antitoxin system AbiEi family antitoxin domain-containing protein [bacterium]